MAAVCAAAGIPARQRHAKARTLKRKAARQVLGKKGTLIETVTPPRTQESIDLVCNYKGGTAIVAQDEAQNHADWRFSSAKSERLQLLTSLRAVRSLPDVPKCAQRVVRSRPEALRPTTRPTGCCIQTKMLFCCCLIFSWLASEGTTGIRHDRNSSRVGGCVRRLG